MRRTALAMALVVGTACGSGAASAPFVDRSVSVKIPRLRIEGLRETGRSVLLPADASTDAADPASMQAMLDDAGLIAAREITFSGGRGVFSRVVIRGWQFSSDVGAQTFVTWLEGDGTNELIGDAELLPGELPGTDVFLHPVTGCCHQEVPIYLAAWQRGDVVWTVRASGLHIRTAPTVSLVRSLQREV